MYNPTLNNYMGDIMNPSMVLEKEINSLNNNNNPAPNNTHNQSNYNPRIRKNNIYIGNRRSKQTININDNDSNNLDSLINSLNAELEKEIENQLRKGDLTPNKPIDNKNEQIQKNFKDKQTYRKSHVLKLNDENSL